MIGPLPDQILAQQTILSPTPFLLSTKQRKVGRTGANEEVVLVRSDFRKPVLLLNKNILDFKITNMPGLLQCNLYVSSIF